MYSNWLVCQWGFQRNNTHADLGSGGYGISKYWQF